MAHDFAAIAANPAAHGFAWSIEPVANKDGNSKITLGDAAIVVVEDHAKFEETFPGVILAALDGSSIRVKSQGVTRRLLEKDSKTDLDTQKIAVLQALAGMRQAPRAEPTVNFPRAVWDLMDEDSQEAFLAANQGKKLVLV